VDALIGATLAHPVASLFIAVSLLFAVVGFLRRGSTPKSVEGFDAEVERRADVARVKREKEARAIFDAFESKERTR
jgi:hypothetical protein